MEITGYITKHLQWLLGVFMQKVTEIKIRILGEWKYRQLKHIQNWIQVHRGHLGSGAIAGSSSPYQQCDLRKLLTLSESQLPQPSKSGK